METLIIIWLSALTAFVLWNNARIRKNAKLIATNALEAAKKFEEGLVEEIVKDYDIDNEMMSKKIHHNVKMDKDKLHHKKKGGY